MIIQWCKCQCPVNPKCTVGGAGAQLRRQTQKRVNGSAITYSAVLPVITKRADFIVGFAMQEVLDMKAVDPEVVPYVIV